jgi:hypothetical protein
VNRFTDGAGRGIVLTAIIRPPIADQNYRLGRVMTAVWHRMFVVVQPAADQSGDIHHQDSNRGPGFLQGSHRA